MTHVWQYQLGYPVKRKGLTLHTASGDPYKYTIAPKKSLSDYNMEQQGDVVSDYFKKRYLGIDAKNLKDYEAVLANFLKNPASTALLPH